MDDYYRGHVPAFGSWDCGDDLPFTQCFEAARQGGAGNAHHHYQQQQQQQQQQHGMFRYSESSEDRDLYVAGDLYDNNVVTPAMIVVPRRRKQNKSRNPHVSKEAEKEQEGWAPPRSPPPPVPHKTPKAVDEDLYKISPHLLQPKPTKKRLSSSLWGRCCCWRPSCDD